MNRILSTFGLACVIGIGSATPAQAGLREAFQRATEAGRQTAERAQEAGRQATERARDTARQAAERVQEASRQAAERAQEAGRHAMERAREAARQTAARVQEASRQSAERASQSAEEARRQATKAVQGIQAQLPGWRQRYEQLREQIRPRIEQAAQAADARVQELVRDPQKRRELLGKVRAFREEGPLALLRVLPVRDPNTGTLTTLDAMARDLAREVGVGGGLGDDPLGTVYLAMVNSDYLLARARLIQGPDGTYLTVVEAGLLTGAKLAGPTDDDIRQLSSSYAGLRLACERGEWQDAREAATRFTQAVAQTNRHIGAAR